tara:strand:- start:3060 stop:3731 length:672 start_codon:yes stop_codon:yes gene_type:complete
MIYDEESDRHIHIPFDQALYATSYGDANGPKGDIFKIGEVGHPDTAKADAHAQDRPLYNSTTNAGPAGTFSTILQWIDGQFGYKKAAGDGKGAEGDFKGAKLDLDDTAGCRILVDRLILLVQAGVWCPIEIVIARPFIEHLMLSAIVSVAGRDTGATLFGPAGTLFALEHLRLSPSISSMRWLFDPSCGVLCGLVLLRGHLTSLCSSSLLSCLQTCRSPPTLP